MIFKNKHLGLIFFGIILTSYFNTQGQSFENNDSLIKIRKKSVILVTNPPPRNIIELDNTLSLTFYSILPENYSERLDNWVYSDSITTHIDSLSFIVLENKILNLDFSDFEFIEQEYQESDLVMIQSGGPIEKYFIETKNHKIEFEINGTNQNRLSKSMKIIRNIFLELEEKYKQ